MIDPVILAWALARQANDRWRLLADAFAGGTTRVSFDGRSVEYRSLTELAHTLAAGYAAENATTRRTALTLASFSRRSAT